jgi:cytochrome oxidase Cu insertion factor (SCO1/SenC/PrrC family)
MRPTTRSGAVSLALLIIMASDASRASSGIEDPSRDAFSTAWVPSSQRVPLKSASVELTDSTGQRRVLGDLLDRPALITFFYTRCQNSGKCSAAVSRLASLQRVVADAGLQHRVRLLAITYEPQFDTPARLAQFATERGLQLGDQAVAVQLDRRRHHDVVDELQAPVNYNADWVNTHGVELTLVDGHGRLVRKYTTILWSNDRVADDLKRLIAEG